MQFRQLAIFGPGLIGGSLALAARRAGLCERLSVWSRDAGERAEVERLGMADAVTDCPAEAVCGADLVILCVPPGALLETARMVAPGLERGATVSDVASVKGALVEKLTDILGSRFVGAHPMAGAERSGVGSARADLFERCVCLLTPLDGSRTDTAALESVSDFWRGLGASVRLTTPQAHDEAVALVSHLPHLVAAALASVPDTEARECAGPGWRDMTRLAAGSPDLWIEILSHNRGPVTDALRQMISRLDEARELLETGRDADLREFLAEGKRRRNDRRAGH